MAGKLSPDLLSALESELVEIKLNAELAETKARIAIANATVSKYQLENLKTRSEMTALRTQKK